MNINLAPPSKSLKYQSTNSFFIRCTVLMPLPVSLATSRMTYPLCRRLITSLYSSFFLSLVLVEPSGLPSLPPLATYCFLPGFLGLSDSYTIPTAWVLEANLIPAILMAGYHRPYPTGMRKAITFLGGGNDRAS